MRKIEVISIPVKDQQKSKDFYVNKIGFTVLVEAPMGNGQDWVQLGLPGTETSITLVTWFDKMPPGSIQGLVLSSENIKNDMKELSAKGVKIGELQNTPWGIFCWFTDPDGNSWTLHENPAKQ